MGSNVAYHFAASLLRSGRKSGQIEKIQQDLGAAVGLMAAERQVVYFLLHPLVPSAKKQELLNLVCESDIVRRLMRILVETKNLNLAGVIYSEYSDMARKELGIVKAAVKTAVELSQEDREKLRQAIARITGKKVLMESSTDPGLMAGVWMRIGDTVIDNTVKAELEMVKARLVS
jgi:F-type H+-transporting ATPase subunit delta